MLFIPYIQFALILVIIAVVYYLAGNRSFMSTHSISHEEVERSVRLLALCSLGSQQAVLSYASIATALKVSA